MTEKQLIEIITQWADEAHETTLKLRSEAKHTAAEYFQGKGQAYENVLSLLITSSKINTPWEV